MLNQVDYIIKNNAVIIYRCYGSGTSLELPSKIEGLPVRELADHCFAPEPSFRYKKHEIRTAVLSEWDSDCSAAFGGPSLTELILPQTLTAIGDYSFYGCLNLERVSVPENLTRLGGGAFVACNHIHEICFVCHSQTDQTPDCLKETLSELTYELTIRLTDLQGNTFLALRYPEYYEESVENTPARIIEIAFHGTGYRYRQCFRGRQIDLHQYDLLFPQAAVLEFPPTLLQLILNRLAYPTDLSEEAKETYLSWIRTHSDETAAWLFSPEQAEYSAEYLKLLGQASCYTAETLDLLLDHASKNGRPDAVSYLMDYRRTHFQITRKKKYEL